jgi:hypothetical protein
MQQRFFFADLIACSTCFRHHYAHHQELKSIIQWLLPVVFCAVVFKLLVWCGAEGYVSGLQDVALLNKNLSLHLDGILFPHVWNIYDSIWMVVALLRHRSAVCLTT